MEIDDEFEQATGTTPTTQAGVAATSLAASVVHDASTSAVTAEATYTETASDAAGGASSSCFAIASGAESPSRQQTIISYSPVGMALSQIQAPVQSFLPDAHGIFHYHRPGGVHGSIAGMHQNIHSIHSLAQGGGAASLMLQRITRQNLETRQRVHQQRYLASQQAAQVQQAVEATRQHNHQQQVFAHSRGEEARQHLQQRQTQLRVLQQIVRRSTAGQSLFAGAPNLSAVQSEIQRISANIRRQAQEVSRQALEVVQQQQAIALEQGSIVVLDEDRVQDGDDGQWVSDPDDVAGEADQLTRDTYELVSRMQRRAMERRTAAGGVSKSHSCGPTPIRTSGHRRVSAVPSRVGPGRSNRLAAAYARHLSDESATHKTVSGMGQGDVDAILQMIRSGTSVDIRDSVGRTPLHVACSCGNVAGARLLIHMGADVNATDNVGNTPLTIAATGARSDVVIPLLEGGADPRVGQGMVSAMTMVRSRLRLLRSQIRNTREVERVSPESLGSVLAQARERRKRAVAVAKECVDIIRLLRIYTQKHIDQESSSGSVLYDAFQRGRDAPKEVLSNQAISELDDLSAQLISLDVSGRQSAEANGAPSDNSSTHEQPLLSTEGKGKEPDVLNGAVCNADSQVIPNTDEGAPAGAGSSSVQEADLIQSQRDEDQIEALLEKFSHLLESAAEEGSSGENSSVRKATGKKAEQ